MKYEILYRGGANAILKVDLEKDESIKAESGAMVSMEGSLDIKGTMDGGFLKGLGRKMFSGESFFFQEVQANRGPGEVTLAPPYPGDVEAIELDGSTDITVQKNGFLGGSSGIDISTKMQNLMKGLFSGEGFFVLRASGKGILFVSSYGGIMRKELAPEEELVVDNQHLVAWTSDTKYAIEKASSKGWISSFTSGEALVCRFTGPGLVFIQTRNAAAFGGWVLPFIPIKKSE
ncbi:MAG TPA: TIGR00266 family protein [Synergistaceae bacterium]|nr:TIGR00266 family protein [Synergistaceae bacterium]HPJ25313.1 TIGR00266 family protein [Synergistaceae bacterium]HPQ36363.1 TIGR00266 family protein [Synergistaceae bacterium]